jgi:uncharacterized membrane protein
MLEGAAPQRIFSIRDSNRIKNVGSVERRVSLTAGALLAILGLIRRDIPGMVAAGLGGAMVYRGMTGDCKVYRALGVSTAQDVLLPPTRSEALEVVESFLINKSPAELYAFWRNLENLPAIMSHLKSVRVLDEHRSHWITEVPVVLGGTVEWDAEITHDEPNSRIAWRSLPEARVSHEGSIEFKGAPGDRGTIVRARLRYVMPGGKLGEWATRLTGTDPERLLREDLRNLKRIMEIGDILTTDGQPRGACFAGIGRALT